MEYEPGSGWILHKRAYIVVVVYLMISYTVNNNNNNNNTHSDDVMGSGSLLDRSVNKLIESTSCFFLIRITSLKNLSLVFLYFLFFEFRKFETGLI